MISGRGSNMKAILDKMKETKAGKLVEISSVFSNNPLAPGIEIAHRYQVPVKIIDSNSRKRSFYNMQLKKWLNEQNPDLIILAGYMLILPADIVELFPNKIINIHPADTKLHQGLHGYKWAWENKLPETKITIHYVDQNLDTGKIIAQYKIDLSNCKSLDEVEKRGLEIEHKFYSKTILDILTKTN